MIFIPQQSGSGTEPLSKDWDGEPDSVPWISRCRTEFKDFYRFSFSPHSQPVPCRDGTGDRQTGYVMLELDGGAKYWVLGMVRNGIPNLPVWIAPEEQAAS